MQRDQSILGEALMERDIVPNFLVVGAMKASTTLLYNMLRRHPQIWLPDEKEPHYFTSPEYGDAKAYKAYLRLFAPCPAGRVFIGEASTGYSKIPFLGPTPARIRETLGEPKIIYILRDPVKRTISNFQHSYLRGYYRPGYRISQAIVEDPIIVGASHYMRQITEYESEFGPSNVLVLIAEELHQNPARSLGEVERLLGASPFDGWDHPIETENSTSSVTQAVVLDRLLSNSPTRALARKIGRHLPRSLKSAILNMAPKPAQAPATTPEDEDAILDLVAGDLSSLRERFGNRLNCWSSSRKLELRRAKASGEANARKDHAVLTP